MRRLRDVREHQLAMKRKDTALRQAQLQRAEARKKQVRKQKIVRNEKRASAKPVKSLIASSPFDLQFVDFENYIYSRSSVINVCHVIESLGMGGGQTMMMELVKGLEKYYGHGIKNFVVCPRTTKYDKEFYSSYGVQPIVMKERDLTRFLANHNIHIVLQHRLAVSKCLRSLLTPGVKYVLMNHTFHQLDRMVQFSKCDFYVSVCGYLHKEFNWSSLIHSSRRIVILNGVENDYIKDIPVATDMIGGFKSGRCHRMVQTKFKVDSLDWLEHQSKKRMPDHHHYLLGHSIDAQKAIKALSHCHYMGSVLNRARKMSLIKGLDLYFYETFQHEGASIAILESAACGVPIVCRDFGGNKELVINGVNGFVVKDRDAFLPHMRELYGDSNKLELLKQSTIDDFNKRLHIKHAITKYAQLFEKLMT